MAAAPTSLRRLDGPDNAASDRITSMTRGSNGADAAALSGVVSRRILERAKGFEASTPNLGSETK
jgi:hypothetical protein